MPEIISHRANLTGIEPSFENLIRSIELALKKGFKVEVDVRFYKDRIYLGHDNPQELLPANFYGEQKIYFHCKDMKSLLMFQKYYRGSNFFTHDNDEATITSKGMLWIHPETLPALYADHTELDFTRAIAVLPERKGLLYNEDHLKFLGKFYGICTDFPERYKEAFDNV